MREVASAEKAIDVEQMQVSGSPCHVSMFIMMACVAKATPFWPQSRIAPLLPLTFHFLTTKPNAAVHVGSMLVTAWLVLPVFMSFQTFLHHSRIMQLLCG